VADLTQYDPAINAAAQEWGQDPNMLRALILQESGGKPGAVSSAGAKGLGGIIPPTAAGLGITDPTDPTQQIFGAAKYLAEGHAKEGTPEGALLYYHGGPDWRQKYGPESAAYVPAVAAHYAALTKGAQGNAQGAQGAAQAPAGGGSGVPSDSDFLKLAAPPAGPPVPSDDDFLKGTGAAPGIPAPEPDTHFSDQGQNEYGITDDPQQFNKMQPGLVAQAVDRVVQAGVKGYQDTSPVFTPQMQAIVDQGPVGRFVTNPLMHALGAIPAAANALGSAGAQAVVEGANAAGQPALGRDINMLAQVAPMAHFGTGVPAVEGVRGVQAAPPSPRFVQEYYREGLPSNPLAAAPAPAAPAFIPPENALLPPRPPEAPAFVPPGTSAWPGGQPEPAPAAPGAPEEVGGPSPGMGGPTPQAAGAAPSSSAEAAMTPDQVLAYRSTAEGRKLLEPQQPGIQDRSAYVPGVNPNEAEIEQTVNAARELKSLGMTAPDVSQQMREIADRNNDTRGQHFAQLAGSPVDVLNAEAARDAKAQTDLNLAWRSAGPADAQPVIDAAQQIKASPDGRRPAVRNVVDAVTQELYGPDGNLITDPEQLYGVRKHIDDLLSEEGKAKNPLSVRATANLLELKGTLDGVITQAAPRFQDYLDNFSAASRPIDAMTVLQAHEPRLFDAQNRMTYAKVQTMMRQIVDSRASPNELNPYKSIPDDKMQQLWNLRDDLRRSASAQELARTPGGSDTTQNLFDALKGAAEGPAGTIGAGITGHVLGGPLGGAVASFGKQVTNNLLSARAMRKRTARGAEMLNPSPDKYPPRNPLQP
jgi:hypothetical protein